MKKLSLFILMGMALLFGDKAFAFRFGVTTDLTTGVSTLTVPGTIEVAESTRTEVVGFRVKGGTVTALTITANKFIGSASDLTNIATAAFNAIGVDTASLRTDVNSAISRANAVAIATAALVTSTSSLQTQINTLGSSTSSLRTDLTSTISRADSVAIATGALVTSTSSLRTDLTSVISRADAVAISTGNIVASTTSLQSQIDSIQAGVLPIIVSTNIAKDAVTHIGNSAAGTLGPNTNVASLSFTTTGSTVVILATWSGAWTVDGSNNANITVQVDRGGSTIAGARGECRAGGLGTSSVYGCAIPIMVVDTPVAGTYTYNLTYNLIAGSAVSTGGYSLIAYELKR